MLNHKIWQDRRVLITGHTGFKGSWLSIWLDMLGAEVIGYALEPYTERDNFVLSKLEGKINHTIGDVRDFQKLQAVFKKHKPEIVFHLAAQPLVRESYLNPKETYDINIGGTVNVLECCRLSESVEIIINVTTDKCYENKETHRGYKENDKLGGYDPYSSSKAASELITAAYRRSFFKPERINDHGKNIASARAGNVIGGGDWQTDRLIPDCINSLEMNKTINIRNPKSIRPWQFVLEPLSGYLHLAGKIYENPGQYCEAWNFGPEKDVNKSVGDITDLVIENWGAGSWNCQKQESVFHEANVLTLDINKAKKKLGWNPILSIEESVKESVQWYKVYKKNDMYKFCESQIISYMDKGDMF